MPLNREWISAHVPHHGSMCLLDEVLHWDEQQIACLTMTHLSGDNPLRRQGRLAAVCGIEYAAQSMAVHGALLAGAGAGTRAGYLASVRAVKFTVEHLDQGDGPLNVHSRRLGGDAATVMYEFALGGWDAPLVAGRAVVVLDAAVFTRPEAPAPKR